MTERIDFDVVIAGSGPAGTATAITLARAGRRVLVLEKRRVARFNIGETIAPMAKGLVENYLGPIDALSSDWAAVNRGNISIWGEDRAFTHDFFFNHYGMGLCVNRDGFDEALRGAATGLGVILWRGMTMSTVTQDPASGDWDFIIDGPKIRPRCIRATYLVDATGRAAAVQEMLRKPRKTGDPMMAFAQRFASDDIEDRDGFSRIEASAFGWWYSNRVPSALGKTSERVVVLHSDPDSAVARQARTIAGFREALKATKLIQPFLDKHGYQPTGRVRGSIAGSARGSSNPQSRFLAVGDAAQAFDPLSSQGVQQALQSGGRAGQALHYALANPEAPQPILTRYAQQMQSVWDTYLSEYQKFYFMETRWPEQPFWRNRSFANPVSQPMNARGV